MTLEHADTIRRRFAEGCKWREVYHRNCQRTLRIEYHLAARTVAAVGRGEPTNLDPETEAEIRRRLAIAAHALPRWKRDGRQRIQQEHGMSGDTLNKILDDDQGVMSVTHRFLTGRL